MSEVNPKERCLRARAAGFEFCEQHVDALVDKVRSLHPASQKVSTVASSVVDRLLRSVIGAAGVSVDEHWTSISICVERVLAGASQEPPAVPTTPDQVAATVRGRVSGGDGQSISGSEKQWRSLGHDIIGWIGTGDIG